MKNASPHRTSDGDNVNHATGTRGADIEVELIGPGTTSRAIAYGWPGSKSCCDVGRPRTCDRCGNCRCAGLFAAISRASSTKLCAPTHEYSWIRQLRIYVRKGCSYHSICLGLLAAADALGVGFVHGVPPHVYLERAQPEAVRRLGLSWVEPGKPIDLYLRVPVVSESIFRAAVHRDEVPIYDILQVWLDVSDYPARGSVQAEQIRRRVLRPLFEGRRP